jgi:hypothetical protein
MSYDPACENLAELFLESTGTVRPPRPADIASLAQTIQDAIEDWLTNFEEGTP